MKKLSLLLLLVPIIGLAQDTTKITNDPVIFTLKEFKLKIRLNSEVFFIIYSD